MFDDIIEENKTKKLIEIECATCMHSVYHKSMNRYSCLQGKIMECALNEHDPYKYWIYNKQ